MKIHAYFPLLAALLSLGLLSGGDRPTWRGIACVDPTSEASMFNTTSLRLEDQLFKEVRSEAEEMRLKKGALEFYNFLSQNELKYYIDAQAAQSAFGFKGPLFHFTTPTVWSQYQAQLQAQNQNVWNLGTLAFPYGPQLTNLWGWKASPVSLAASGIQVPAARPVLQPTVAMQQSLPFVGQSVSALPSIPSRSYHW